MTRRCAARLGSALLLSWALVACGGSPSGPDAAVQPPDVGIAESPDLGAQPDAGMLPPQDLGVPDVGPLDLGALDLGTMDLGEPAPRYRPTGFGVSAGGVGVSSRYRAVISWGAAISGSLATSTDHQLEVGPPLGR